MLDGGYKDNKDACARGAAADVTSGCQGITTKSAHIHTYRGSHGHEWASVAEMRYRREAYLYTIFITCSHPPRPRLSCISLTNDEFDEYCEDDCGLCLELGENCNFNCLNE